MNIGSKTGWQAAVGPAARGCSSSGRPAVEAFSEPSSDRQPSQLWPQPASCCCNLPLRRQPSARQVTLVLTAIQAVSFLPFRTRFCFSHCLNFSLVCAGVKMLIRVHEESFVLFFFNSFILLDKKPFFIAAFCILSAFFIFAFMGNKILRGDDVNAFLKP